MKSGEVYEIARLNLEPEAIAGFPAAAAAALDVLRSAPGCRSAHLLGGIENAGNPLLVVHWETVDAHLAFRESALFPRYRGPIQDSFAAPPTFEHYEVAL